jgi:arylformamidase
MKRYDVTMPITPTMMVYKNKEEKKPIFHVDDQLAAGKSYETTLTMNLHTGTHMDFPLHMQENGSTSTGFDPSTLLRMVRVIELRQTNIIEKKHLEALGLRRGDFVLFKTDNSFIETFAFDFTFVSQDAARYLVTCGIAGVGIDALGIERDQPDHQTHHTLMNAGILILEGLRLKDVPAGDYDMIALPLSIPNRDALPLRVLLEAR